MTNETGTLKSAVAHFLQAELARQWGTEFNNYIKDIDWQQMARVALHAHRGHRRATMAHKKSVTDASRELAQLLAATRTPDRAEAEALCFLLDLITEDGWHPHGYAIQDQRNMLFTALVDALEAMHNAAGYVDNAAIQRATAVVDKLIDATKGLQP